MPPKKENYRPVWWNKDRKALALQIWLRVPRPTVDKMEEELLATCKPDDKAKMTKISENSIRAQVFTLALAEFKKSDGTVLTRNKIADKHRIPHSIFADDRNIDGNWEKKRPALPNTQPDEVLVGEVTMEVTTPVVNMEVTTEVTPLHQISAVVSPPYVEEIDIQDMEEPNEEESRPPNKPSAKPITQKDQLDETVITTPKAVISKLSKVTSQLALSTKPMIVTDERVYQKLDNIEQDMKDIKHLLEQIVKLMNGVKTGKPKGTNEQIEDNLDEF